MENPEPIADAGAMPTEAPVTTGAADESIEALKAKIAELEGHKKTLNKENASWRTKLSAYEKAEAEKQNADKSELEKAGLKMSELQKRLDELEGENRGYKRERAFAIASAVVGAKFANETARDDALNFLPAELDFDDADAVKAALNEMKKNRPYLFAQAATPPPSTDAGSRGQTKPGEITDSRRAELQKRFNLRR